MSKSKILIAAVCIIIGLVVGSFIKNLALGALGGLIFHLIFLGISDVISKNRE